LVPTDPADWPAWCDLFCWQPGPETEENELAARLAVIAPVPDPHAVAGALAEIRNTAAAIGDQPWSNPRHLERAAAILEAAIAGVRTVKTPTAPPPDDEPCLEHRVQSRAFKLGPHNADTCPYCTGTEPRIQLPPDPEPEPFEPTAEDLAEYRAWCAEVDARQQDEMDARREADYLDQLDREHRFTDADLAACGLPVG
jgi:hypothetical protein